MNVHEFQGKSLLKTYNVDIQEGFVAETPEHAVTIANQLKLKFGSEYFVVKRRYMQEEEAKAVVLNLQNQWKKQEGLPARYLGCS